MSVNHQRALQLIHSILGRARGSTVYGRLSNARDETRRQRENNGGANCQDMDLVAADHYLEARLQVNMSDTAYPITFVGANFNHSLYESIKFILDAVGQRQRLRTGNCPVSPPSLDVIRWARAGTRNGFRDRRTHATAQNMRLPEMSDISASELNGW